jgi:hypothetical protein
MTDFKKIMEHGLVIFSGSDELTHVRKIETPTSRTRILVPASSENDFDLTIKTFASYEAAVSFCEKFIEGGVEEANLQEAKVQLAYNPTGHFLKAKSLENVKAASYKEAMEMATQLAMAFFKEEGITKKVGDNFEVKVIPVT